MPLLYRLGFILVSPFPNIAFVLWKDLLNWRVKLRQEATCREPVGVQRGSVGAQRVGSLPAAVSWVCS